MNYKLNFAAMFAVFSIVTYNVCMAYQDMNGMNIQNKFQMIGLLSDEAAQAKVIVPLRKPAMPDNQMAAL